MKLRRVGSRSEILDTAMEEVSVMEGEAMEEVMGEVIAIAVVIVGVTEVMEGMVETIMGEEGTGMTMVAMEDMETIMEGMGDMVTTTRVDW